MALLKRAGVDLSKPEAVQAVMHQLDGLVARLVGQGVVGPHQVDRNTIRGPGPEHLARLRPPSHRDGEAVVLAARSRMTLPASLSPASSWSSASTRSFSA